MRAYKHFLCFLVFCLILIASHTNAQARPLNVCTHLGFEPFVINEGKILKGIDIDIIVQILTNIKQSADIKAYPWKRLLSTLESGQCDIGFSLFDTPQRREYVEFLFTVPMHYSTYSLFVAKSKQFPFIKLTDLFGKTIAQNRGFSLTVGFEQAIADGKIKRISFDNADSALQMLDSGRVDAVLDNEQRFRYYLKSKGKLDRIKALNIPFLPHHPAFLVVSKKSDFAGLDNLKKKLRSQLKQLHLNGTILNINTRYLN